MQNFKAVVYVSEIFRLLIIPHNLSDSRICQKKKMILRNLSMWFYCLYSFATNKEERKFEATYSKYVM